MFAGASPATGTAPVPVSGTVCGLPVALSATLTFALFAPVVVGANFTPTLQLALAVSLGQSHSPCGNQKVGTSSATTDLTITNNGSAQLNITSITLIPERD